MKIVVVNGMPGSGKTTFEMYCKSKLGAFCEMRSTVDKVKQIASMCGWNGAKELKDRKFLSDLKDLLNDYNDLPMNDIKESIRVFREELLTYGVYDNPAVFFIDDREPEHIQRVVDELGATTLLIRRADVEHNETSNHADSNVFNFDYDIIIENNGDLDELYHKADKFLEKIIGVK